MTTQFLTKHVGEENMDDSLLSGFYLYSYRAGTVHGLHCTLQRAVRLDELRKGTYKALYCLSMHLFLFQIVPICSQKEWTFLNVCVNVTISNFEWSWILCFLSFHSNWANTVVLWFQYKLCHQKQHTITQNHRTRCTSGLD